MLFRSVSSALLVIIFLLAFAVRLLVPYDATEIEVGNSFAAPFSVSAKDIGNYALRFEFSDGHRTGLYSYDYLRSLAGKM